MIVTESKLHVACVMQRFNDRGGPLRVGDPEGGGLGDMHQGASFSSADMVEGCLVVCISCLTYLAPLEHEDFWAVQQPFDL